MGRLFWKFFFFVWLAQLSTILGVTAYFWWKDQQPRREAVQVAAMATPGPPSWAPDQPRKPPPPVEPLIAGFPASLAFAALLAAYFSRPIRTLQAAFDAAARGNLEVRVGAAMGQRRDELAELGKDFDRMAAQLQALVEGQRRLLHDVSHELRSPLARLEAAAGLARQQPAKLEASMDRIEKECMRMDRLVGELLTLARLEAGMAGGRREEIDFQEILATIVADAGFEAVARGVAVELAGDCEGMVDGDGELLHRAVENVVRNAVKYSPPGARVTVAAGMGQGKRELSISVLDQGPGVPEDDLEAIFLPFHRGSSPRDNNGHGLGLAIARQVVESLGGRIRAGNRAEGGLSVEITLPVRLPAEYPPSPLPEIY